jgi:two-component system, cell cycle response regulator DivK
VPTGRVLLIEDDVPTLEIFSTFLRHHGIDVAEATCGADGIESAKALAPRLIFMDLSMPDVDGFECMRRLRDDPETSRIPVVALTAHAMSGDRERVMRAGFTGYLPKPIEPRALLKEAVRLLGAAS